MSVVLQRETTEYLYTGVTGEPPSNGAETAVLEPGMRPSEPDWNVSVVVTDSHDLWADAQRSVSSEFGTTPPDYFVACLIGSFGGNTLDPGEGDYLVWIRLTDQVERPVRISPIALEIE
jgi:hypothetical protein